jgi:Phage tail assembly chaperone proteins, E, or 41 or 14
MTEVAQTLTLSKTLKALDGTTDITELKFQEMVVEDFIDYDMRDMSKVKLVINLTAKLTGHERKIFDKMSGKDYLACSNIINVFFGISQEIPDRY